MGSQILEILRQGIWASFTGGWFFDPHQEIFCNTFHLYLWMYFLLLPFVIFLTTDSSYVSLIVYPSVIFATFTILKAINHRLHKVFDTGEVREIIGNSRKSLEVNVETDDGVKIEDVKGREADESIEMEVLKKVSSLDSLNVETNSVAAVHLSEPSTPTISHVEVDECITITVDGKSDNNDTESDNSIKEEDGQPEIVVVDVHKDTTSFSKPEDQQSNPNSQGTGQESPLSSNSENMLPPLKSETPVHASDAVIANQGVLSDVKLKLYSNDSLALVRPPSPSPLCLRRLIDTSSDSSWSSSTGSSGNIFEDAKEPPAVLDVTRNENCEQQEDNVADVSSPNGSITSGTDFIDKKDNLYNNFASNMENFKSENILTATGKEQTNNDNGNKAVSMSALESKPADVEEPSPADKFAGTGARPKTNQAVWFSLPEMEKSNDELNLPMKKDDRSSTDAGSGESSDFISMAMKFDGSGNEADVSRDENEDDVKSETQKKSDGESDTISDLKSELLGSLDRRTIRRRGAIRPTVATPRERGSLRSRRQRTASDSGGFPLLSADEELCNSLPQSSKHLALSHDDTTAGAVHCFQDEFGQWHTYMFGDEQMEVQPSTTPFTDPSIYSSSLLREVRLRELLRNSRRGRPDASTPSMMENELEFERMCSEIQEFRRRHFQLSEIVSLPNSESIQSQSAGILKIQDPEEPVKHHYKVPVVGSFTTKISFDRLFLLALLDRDKSSIETVAAVILATLTAVLGYLLLSRQYVYDFWVFALCFVIAKCQFSLLKSVQPDSASPIHGHNNIITFSRAIYFCVIGSLILILDEITKLDPVSPTIYGVRMYSRSNMEFARDMLIDFLLAFPVIFLFGLLPQITTFTMYVLEQVDIHFFGGTAMTGLPASLYSLARSIVSVSFLYGFAFVALQNESRGQHVLFSVFCGLLVAVSYHLSRCSSDPAVLWGILKRRIAGSKGSDEEEEEVHDPLPEKLAGTVQARICHDLIACFGIVVVVFAVHVSTAFTVLQPTVSYVLYIVTGIVGILNHYVFPQLRKQLPWSLVASPVLKSAEYHLFEARGPAKIMWFEQIYAWLFFVEKNILYPVTFLSALTTAADDLVIKFGEFYGPFIITICGLKLLRQSFSNTPRQYLVLIWTVLFFNYDFRGASETMPVDYFVMSIFVDKALDLYLKFCFIFTYTAPWQITWGSACHAFAQPFSVPHCGMLFLQAVVSAFFSAPLNPILGSAIFITSYVRPIKFWEKNYNTKRVDHSNTRLSTHLDSNPGLDDNNLNSIFYEHLTRSLQHSLCGDLMLGRWGTVASGDCFVMASDYLNALVHIIEIGNGLVTFQLRGLEFRGTYCQQREVEAITESVEDDRECCCFDPGHLPNMLSFNMTFNLRWLAWEVVQSKYILEGYSISDNTATSMFQVFDLRKIFITYYVKAIIFYTVKSSKLSVWLNDESLMTQLSEMRKSNFVDLDATFRPMTDEDYDIRVGGVSRTSFCNTYQSWIEYCNRGRKEEIDDDGESSNLVTLCFALSLLGRRLFSTASHQQTATLKSFLYGLHALFKGDFRVTSAKDEWVFAEPDMELLRKVIAPAVRMSVKLHQDHFTSPDEYDDNFALYRSISNHEEDLVISHEGHPIWRQAVLNNKPSLLALRYVMDEGTDDYKIIMLNKRQLSFRVVKVNRECVRGLWAGQLQELIFLRNRNPERGSIQNAKQALRNMVNSSLDQPIGYPIYVSPLTTSYADTNVQFTDIIGGPFSSKGVRRFLSNLFQRLRERYGHTCQSGSGHANSDAESPVAAAATPPERLGSATGTTRITKAPATHLQRGSSFGASYSAVPSTSRRSSTSTSGAVMSCNLPPPVAGPISENILRARIKDISQVLDSVNVRNAVELEWPSDDLLEKSGKNGWGPWYPHDGLEGVIVHRWEPNHPNPVKRSHLDRTLYLLKVEEHYIPVVENGIQILNEVEV